MLCGYVLSLLGITLKPVISDQGIMETIEIIPKRDHKRWVLEYKW